MADVSIAEAKAKFSEIVAAVEAGETRVITRRGKAVAKIVGPDTVVSRPVKTLDLTRLDTFLSSMPTASSDGPDTVARMRDGYRY